MNKANIKIIAFAFILILFAGVLDNVQDTLAFKYESSIFPQVAGEKFLGKTIDFWAVQKLPEGGQSWKNKYKDRNPAKGRAFLGSKTWLVFLTDGWHLAQFFKLLFLGLAFGLKSTRLLGLKWYYLFLFPFAFKAVFGGGWSIGDKAVNRKSQ